MNEVIAVDKIARADIVELEGKIKKLEARVKELEDINRNFENIRDWAK